MKKRSRLAVCVAFASAIAMTTGPSMSVMAAYTDPDASLEREAANAATSQQVATEGMVLLDNQDATLPIKGGQVALYGPGSYDTIRGGTGSGATYLRNDPVTVWQGFKDSGVTIVNDDYVNKMNDIFQENGGFEVNTMGNGYIQSEIMFDDEDKAAIEATDPSVPAVYVISRTSAEGADHTLEKGDYYLTDAEYQNLKVLGSHFDQVTVVINTGCVIDTSFYNGGGTPDYESHDITSKVHDVTYEAGKYYTKDEDGNYTLAEGDYEEGKTYYSATDDYVPAEVTQDNFVTDGSLYTATLTYVETNIANASDIDPSKTYYTASTDEEGNVQYNAVMVDSINFAQYDNLYYGENEYNPVGEGAEFASRGVTYYTKGGYVEADVASTFKQYVDAGCLYVKDGDSYRLVGEDETYDASATYSEGWNTEKIDGLTALVFMGQGGMNGGVAVVDCLIGNSNFSGKTTDTWAKNYSDYPSSGYYSWEDGDTVDENFREDIYVGYRYFDTYGVEPAYPFGYGLSYTDFTIKTDSVEATPDTITVTATVTNTGDTAGKEVVEVYFSAPDDTDIDMPFQELAGFGKTSLLEPGESETVTVSFATSELASYHEDSAAYIIEDGAYKIRVGNSSRNTVEAAEITVDKDVTTEQCENVFTLTKDNMLDGSYDSSATMSSESYAIDMLTGSDEGITPSTDGLEAEKADLTLNSADFPEAVTHDYGNGEITAYVGADSDYEAKDGETLETVEVSSDGTYTLRDVSDGKITMEQLVADMSPIELIDLVQGESYEGVAASSKDSDVLGYMADMIYGSCGGTTSNMYNSRYIPNIETVDGGAGVRINTSYQIYNAVPVDAEYQEDVTYYTCQFSAWGGSSYNEITFADADEFKSTLESGTRLYTTDGETAYQYCSATPVGTVIAQTWNPELAEIQGRAIATEMLDYGATLWLAPGMCIHRDVLCGRNFEYYSEDPLVTGNMVSALTEGVMTKEDGSLSGVSTMPKHFAVNSQENDRFGGNNMASERAIREIYLNGFERVVKNEQPYAVMSCYNQINGVPGYNNYSLLTEVLVNEWGFEGFVCTDWLSYYGSANCTAASTSAKVPATGAIAYDSGSEYGVSGDDAYKTQVWQLEAGNSLEMPGQNEEKVLTGWNNGEIRLGDLQHCAMQILNSTMRSHQFEQVVEKLEEAGR